MAEKDGKPSNKKKLPQKAQNQQKSGQQVVATQVSVDFEGPLPPPHILRAYEEISPGFSDRIIKMAESETAHRHKMENKELSVDAEFGRKEFTERRIGQIFGLMIGLSALAAGTITAIFDHPITGGFMGTGGVVALVTAFIYGKKMD